MDRGRYSTCFRLSLILSILIHVVMLVAIRLPSPWVRGEVEHDRSRVLMFFPSDNLPVYAGREAASMIDYTETFDDLVPLTLREARPLDLPHRLTPSGLFPGQPLSWYDILDVSSIKLLPPYYFERFAWQIPDTTKRQHSVNDFLQRAFLEAMLARQKKERLLVDTALGEFGITPGVVHLGPITLPIPFAPYSSIATRTYQRQFEEIKSHESQVEIDDDELARQRERILEWKKRQGTDP